MVIEMKKQRLTWADTARGAAILLVLVGHTCPPPYTTALIYAFHMPLFFILSGLFLRLDDPLKPLLWRRVRTLLVPFVFYNLVLLASDWCIVALSPNHHDPVNIPARLLGTLTGWRSGSWNSSLWFLPALFVAQWLVIGCYRLAPTRPRAYLFLWVVLSLLGVAWCQWVGVALPFSLDAALIASGFLLMGQQWLKRGFSGFEGWYWVVTAIIFVVSAIDNFHHLGGGDNHVDLSTCTLGQPFNFYIAAAAGSLLIIRLCQIRVKSSAHFSFFTSHFSSFMQWMGRNSLAIYCLHRIPMNLGIAIWKATFATTATAAAMPPTALTSLRSLLLTLFTILLLIPAVYIVNRWLPWSLGKPSKHHNP